MKILLKLVALIALVAVATPLVAPDTTLGRVVRATLADLAGFCDRQPEACAGGAELARDAAATVRSTLEGLASPEPDTLTAEDRALDAKGDAAPMISTHGRP